MQLAWKHLAMVLSTLSITFSNMSASTLPISRERPNRSTVNTHMADLGQEQRGHLGP